jgi:hypothetical protein
MVYHCFSVDRYHEMMNPTNSPLGAISSGRLPLTPNNSEVVKDPDAHQFGRIKKAN